MYTVNHSLSSLVSSDSPLEPYEFTVPNPESEFDIIDTLDYDDTDDGLFDQEMIYQKREALIQELYQTEKDYVKNVLGNLQTSYISPLRKNKQSSFGFLGIKKQPCTEREMTWLFGNIEKLLEIHQSILTSLEERLRIWGPTQIMSDVITAWFPNVQKLYHIYLEHYSVSVSTYERLSRYQPFKKFLESVEKKENTVHLLNLLKVPNTCVLRYAKILTSLADSTPTMHPDYVGLVKCRQRAEQLFEEFRPAIANAKNVDQVYEVHCSMTDLPFGITAERRLYLQGDFIQISKSGAGEERTYILFSDMLVYARRKKSLQYKGHILLDQTHVQKISKEEAGGESHCIEIISSFQGVDSLNTTFMASPTAHILKTANENEQEEWLSCLESAIANLKKNTGHGKMSVSQGTASPTKKPGTTVSTGSNKSVLF